MTYNYAPVKRDVQKDFIKKKLIAAKQGQKINIKFNKYLHIKKRKRKERNRTICNRKCITGQVMTV